MEASREKKKRRMHLWRLAAADNERAGRRAEGQKMMKKQKISQTTRHHAAMSIRFLPVLGLCLALIAKATSSELEEPLAGAETTPIGEQDFALLSQPFDYHANMPVITKRELASAIAKASQQVQRLRANTEPSLQADSRLLMEAGSPGWLTQTMFHRAAHDERALNQTDQALISEEATRLLAKQFKLTRLQTLRGLPLISVDQTNLGRLCQRSSRNFNCLAGQYRSLSGHCNNVQNPDWGAARGPLVRYAPASYLDNVARPAESADSEAELPSANRLPSARAVSAAIYGERSGEKSAPVQQQHSHMTTMMSFFGQFVFHDLAQVAQFATAGGASTIRCCGLASRHPECMPIQLERYCLDYVRSTPAIRSGCNLGPRDQLNLVTSYLDGSAIYGSSEGQVRRLRSFSGGRLRAQPVSLMAGQQPAGAGQQQVELLPQIKPSSANESSAEEEIWLRALDDCAQLARMRRRPAGEEPRCFQAGDSRANENIGLTLMHTIWLREHNLIADKLSQINKHWRDQRLFDEARRLVVAELQHITYAEFLPNIIGQEVMQRFNLTTLTQGYFQGYDPQLNAAVSNELAAAVFPFILSTIPSSLERYSDRLEMLGTTHLADTFMDGSELFKRNRFAQYLMGMMSQNAMDPLMATMPMTMALNASEPASSSAAPLVDVLALTIQQARDHGLKPYLYWRQACQLRPQVSSWQDLAQVMPAPAVERLRKVYSSPEQLDLYLALLETPLPGATVGPTFVCLLARQFFHLKHGDRYWYENDLPRSAFSAHQLEQIRQTNLAKVVCRNTNSLGVSFIQPAPMLASDPYLNAYQYCTNRAMVQLDLSKWREPVTSAQQVSDELMMGELEAAREALARGRQLLEAAGGAQLVGRSLRRARRQLDQELAVGRGRERPVASGPVHAAYRHSARQKRQSMQRLSNQSLLFELATNEMVRALVHQGKDREQARSVEADIRDFLYSLEMVQLDNLLDNSGDSARLRQFIASAGESFLEAEQRTRLLQATGQETGAEQAEGATRTSSVSADCQDDDRAFPCDHTSPFRTITGWCNNLQRPKFGQSFTPLDRLLPNAYEDGLARPRQLSVALAPNSAERARLPSARLVSTSMHDDRSQLHARYSLALMQFGQFGVDHDLTRTPFSLAPDGSLLDCSACDSQRQLHRDCLPIEIPAGDAHFESARARELRGTERKCLHFVRSLNGQTGMGPRQQMNALTAYLDASNIYGSDNCEARSLRAMQGGRLNGSAAVGAGGRELLPLTRANPECVTPAGVCFHAGDQRASEQPGLSAIHTVFMRLHNSLVGQLGQVNRHWNDERLYQQGRRIVGAIMQRITYNEFAPRILGLDYISKFDLLLKNVGYSDAYDPDCSASILTEFAAAAFRMGHSLIRNAFPLLNKQFKPIGKAFQLRKAFFNSQRILQEPFLIDAILRGVVSTPIETLDNSITEELTNHLFERPKEPFSGMDLISLNIQRARDHGIPGYNKYRAKCNLTRARTFDELSAEIPNALIKRLQSLYAHPDDIDLFTGGMSELPVHGGIIGPTLGCIIGLQLSRLKRCDRFWHETSDPYVRFSPAQLAEIRKMTLAKVICQESDTIDSIQRQAMDVPDQYLNPRLPCSSLPAMDLSVWRENLKSCLVSQANNKPAVKLELGQSKRLSPCRSCTCTSEGPICRSAKIDCVKAMGQSASQLAALMADKACLVQCAWALDMQPLVAG